MWYAAARRWCFCFFFNDTATTEIYTLSLHDALPIFVSNRDEYRASQGEGSQPHIDFFCREIHNSFVLPLFAKMMYILFRKHAEETGLLSKLIPETKVLDACRTLFGEDVSLRRDFLFYLQPTGAKTAFRKIAKETHPDHFANEPSDIQKRQNDQFRDVLQAYELLNTFFRQRDG